MDELNSLRKKNGETLDCNEWNKLVSVINYIIEFYNQYPTKLSEFENDINFVSEENISSVIQELINNGTLSSILGEPGADGKSAYLLALENGFIGTITEWLASLKGLKGSDGKSAFVLAIDNGYTGTLQQWLESLKGQPGINGENGIDGKSAYQSYVDTTSDDPILTEEEWIASLKGEQGENGLNGSNGQDGLNGITPHIDLTTGNWFIGNSDTGVHALGPAGLNGQDGTTADLLLADWNQTDNTSADFIKNKPGVGVANGLATLDSNGKVSSSQLPSYVDDVIEGYYHNNKFYEHYTLNGDDAAQAAWSEGWRIPTKDEYVALSNAVNAVWTSDYNNTGIAGLVCTDKVDSSKVLFFPAAGGCFSGSVLRVGHRVECWTSSLVSSDVLYAYSLFLNDGGSVNWLSDSTRYDGFPIRPILASGNSTRPYVEIGGVKWSTMNIGASAETDVGLYFQWGDIQGYTASQVGSGEGQKYFGWADYKYGNGTSDPGADGMTKYNSTDGLTTLQLGTQRLYIGEIIAEASKIYLDIPTNCSYRWSGTAYVLIGSSKTLSDWNETDTSSPAYILNKPTIINGTNGTNGKSAFELAVDNGFVGTVELWLASLKGLDGQDGLDGSDGLNGTNGTNGTDGITPHIDPVTKHWMIGNTDTNVVAEGKDGTASAAGADGKSAYQSYVDTTSDDPVLTELQWVASLHGADGTNGLNGTNGQDGVTPTIDPTTKHWMLGSTDTGVIAEGQNGSNGTNGTDGITPHIDLTTGHWFIGTTDTNIDATGPAGLNGTNGTNGTDGVTPHIDSTTGNWFIGSTDTGVHAQGPSGTSLSNETATQGGSTLSAVTTGEKYNWNNKASIWSGTLAQYDALSPNYDSNTIYIITAAS